MSAAAGRGQEQDHQPTSRAAVIRTRWVLACAALLLLAVKLAPAGFASKVVPGFVPLHMAVETFAIIVAMLIFGVAWNVYSSERPGNVLILACGFLAVGLIDFAHMLSGAGMPDFVTPAGDAKAVVFQFAASLLAAGTLLALGLRDWPKVVSRTGRHGLLATSLGIGALIYWIGLYRAELIPPTFVAGKGLTPPAIVVECCIIAVFLAAACLLRRTARRRGSFSALFLSAACSLFVLSELCFFLYTSVGDAFDVLGHVFKIAAYALIYRAVFVYSVRSPFERLSRARADNERATEEVRRVNKELEQRVAERTANLTQANQSLRDGATRIQSILDTVAEGIISVDEGGVIGTFNPAAERIFGYAAAEVIGRNSEILMATPDDANRQREQRRRVGQAGVIGTGCELIGRRKDGSAFPMEFSMSDMRLGSKRYFTWIARDITQRKIADEQIRKLSLAVEQSAQSIMITDLDGRIEYVNSGLVQATGYSRDELIGKNPRVLQSGKTPRETYVAMWSALTVGQPWKGELYNRKKDGSEYVEYALITPLYQPGGAISHYVAVKEDITERKRLRIELERHRDHLEELVQSRTLEASAARQQAEAANLAKSSFLATMSHEIRTPLGGMMGMLELLWLSPLTGEQRDTLQMARDSARALLRILNDILDFSKIEQGKLELAPRATSIAALVAEVANTYAHVASGKSVTLAQQVDARLSPAHMVDGLRLSQVLNNFVSNAIKFSHSGGRVSVQARLVGSSEGGEEVRFSVEDTGIGIEPQVQQRLFRQYSQASAETAHRYGGTGLGLTICRRLADLMQGHIDLVSQPGQGSTFGVTLTLPLAPANAQPEPIPAGIPFVPPVRPLARGAGGVDRLFVLVVDDHPINRQLLASQLALLGLRAETASDGEDALPLWRTGRHALVITDCHMPKVDGYRLASTIRAIEAHEGRVRTPILGWTADALAQEVERCKAAGMDELLIKPTELMQLKQKLEQWLPAAGRPSEQSEAAGLQDAVASPPFDLTFVAAMCGANRAAVREQLQAFRRTNDEDTLLLRQAVAEDDLAQVTHTAHRMLGSSSIVRARDVADACRRLVHASRAGDSETVGEVMQALQGEFHRLNAYIDTVCAEADKTVE